MRVGGLTSTTVLLKGYDGAAWRNLLADPRGALQLLNVPWPLYKAPGRLIFYEDFEGVLKWGQREGTVSRDNTVHVFDGNYALKLLTGAVAGNVSRAFRSISFPGLAKFRFMCHWHAWGGNVEGDDVKVRDVQFELDFYDGTNVQQPQVRYLHYLNAGAQNKWQYLNAAAVWTDIPGGSQVIHSGMNVFAEPTDNFLMVDVDISSGDPIINRLISNDLDLTGLSLTGPKSATTDRGGIDFHLKVTTDVAAAVAAYFDDVALGDTTWP